MSEKIIEWGFDLTDFGSVTKFKNLLKKHKLLSGYKVIYPYPKPFKNDFKHYTWRNKDLLLVTANNPITGEYSYSKKRKPEKGFASYIGIKGKESKVKSLADDIRKTAEFIKEESPYKRDFI